MDTWTSRDLPILRAVLARVDALEVVGVADITADTGLSRNEVWAGLRALESAQPPYLELDAGHVDTVFERGRRIVGTWPSADELVDRLASALHAAAEEETEPDRKNRFRVAAEAIAGTAKDLAVGVFAEYLSRRV